MSDKCPKWSTVFVGDYMSGSFQIMRDGVAVYEKSGAFGDDDSLLTAYAELHERVAAMRDVVEAARQLVKRHKEPPGCRPVCTCVLRISRSLARLDAGGGEGECQPST